jgi:hypothetical protein
MSEPMGGVPGRNHTLFGDCPIPEQVMSFVAKVLAPGDGDTCTVALELPNRFVWIVTLRYWHCFAPERSEEGGVSTANYNTSIIMPAVWGTVMTRGRLDQRSRLVGDLYLYNGKGQQMLDVSKLVSKFIADHGFGQGNS